MRFALIAALLAACTTDTAPANTTGVGAIVVRDCGAAPLAPGWAVAHDSGHATMTDSDFAAIESWRSAVETWNDCVTNHQ